MAGAGRGPGPSEVFVDLLPVVKGQKGGFGNQYLYDLVLSNKAFYAVPLDTRMHGTEVVKAVAGNWAVPGLGNLVVVEKMAREFMQTVPQRWQLYTHGHAGRMARSSPGGLVVFWLQVKDVRMTGALTKYAHLVLHDHTYFFQSVLASTEAVFQRIQAVLTRSRVST